MGPYILDFYCPAERLAVELDGAVHDDPAQRTHDAERDRALAALGIRVVRFENRTVLETPEAVLDAIVAHFASPPPHGGGGRGVVR